MATWWGVLRASERSRVGNPWCTLSTPPEGFGARTCVSCSLPPCSACSEAGISDWLSAWLTRLPVPQAHTRAGAQHDQSAREEGVPVQGALGGDSHWQSGQRQFVRCHTVSSATKERESLMLVISVQEWYSPRRGLQVVLEFDLLTTVCARLLF